MRRSRLLVSLSLLAVLASPVAAQDRALDGFSFRAGAGFDPGQAVVGLDVSLGKFFHLLRVRPVAQLGFGDGTTFDGSLDFLARFSVDEGRWGIYAGLAPTFGINWRDGDSDDFFSGTTILGVQLPLHPTWGTSVELRWMWDDSAPDFRLMGVINP